MSFSLDRSFLAELVLNVDAPTTGAHKKSSNSVTVAARNLNVWGPPHPTPPRPFPACILPSPLYPLPRKY